MMPRNSGLLKGVQMVRKCCNFWSIFSTNVAIYLIKRLARGAREVSFYWRLIWKVDILKKWAIYFLRWFSNALACVCLSQDKMTNRFSSSSKI